MKKLLLIPALMLGTMAIAQDYNYELTPVVGYNIAEGNLDIDNQTLVGLEAQYNGLESILSPELSVLYTNAEYDNTNISTNIYRIALNGVYEYKKLGFMIPLAKVGIGYETLNVHLNENRESAFFDAGVGAKIPFTDNIAMKLEAIYMLKPNHANMDSNLALLAGLNYAFGAKAQPEPVAAPAPVPVDGDDDNDGVKNSMDKCPTTDVGVKVDADGCKIDGDDDNDGVKNSIDKCPDSPANAAVNADGCPIIVNLHINFENDSYKIDSASDANVQKFADFLNMYKNYSAKIVGYTDSRASAKHNQKLSQNRANAVKALLVKKGVSADKVSVSGMGEANPIADNSTKEGRAENRRIEAELIKN